MTESETPAKATPDGLIRRPLPKGRVYHFNVIYNHARCPLSKTADTEMSLAWTQRAVENLQLLGLVNSYYHDRDCPKMQGGMARELARVIAGSEVTVVVLSPGFVRDCWPRYCLFPCFKQLFASGPSSSSGASRAARGSAAARSSPGRYSPAASSARASPVPSASSSSGSCSPRSASDPPERWRCGVVVVALGLEARDLPAGLVDEEVLFFSSHWQEDGEAWGRLEGSLMSALPPAGLLQDRSDAALCLEQSTRAAPSASTAASPRSPLQGQRHTQDSNGVTSSLSKEHAGSTATSPRASRNGVTSSLYKEHTGSRTTSPSSSLDDVTSSLYKEHIGSRTTSPRSSRDDVASSLSKGHSRSPASSPRPSLVDPRPREDRNGVTTSLFHTSTITTTSATYRHSPSLYNGDSFNADIGDHQSSLHSNKSDAGDADAAMSRRRPDSAVEVRLPAGSTSSPPAAQGARRQQRASGEGELMPALDAATTRLAEGVVQSYDLNSGDGGNRPPRGLDRQHEIHTVEHTNRPMHFGDVKQNVTDDHHKVDIEVEPREREKHQGSRSVNDSGAVSMNSPSDNIESAVLDRLGQAGFRRESLQESSMMRVFARGNTVSAGTPLAASFSQRRQDEDSTNENSLSGQNFGSGANAVFKVLDVNERVEDKVYSRRSEKDDAEVLGGHNTSIQSSKTTTQYAGGYAYPAPSDASKNLAISTNSYEKAVSGSLTPQKDGRGLHSETIGFSEGDCSAEFNQPNNSSLDQYREVSQHQPRVVHKPAEASTPGGLDDVDSSSNIQRVHNNQLGVTLTSASAQRVKKIETKTSRIQTPSGGQPLAKDAWSTKNHEDESLSASDIKVSNDESGVANTSSVHLHEDVKLAISVSTNTRPEVDGTTSEYHHITSIEDEHDLSLNDYLSSSLTTSDYGTMSPRNDFSGLSNTDSGFLSGGLSSYGEISPRMSTPRSKIQEKETLAEGDKVSGKKATGGSVSTTCGAEHWAILTERQGHETANGGGEVVGTAPITRSSSGQYNNDENKIPQPNMDRLTKTMGLRASGLHLSDKSPAMSSKHEPLIGEPPRLAAHAEEPVFGSSDSGHGFHRTPSGNISSTTECKVAVASSREAVRNEVTGQVARAARGSQDDVIPVTTRKDSWIYEDVDKDWTMAEMLLPLYRIMCYALSRPELPFF